MSKDKAMYAAAAPPDTAGRVLRNGKPYLVVYADDENYAASPGGERLRAEAVRVAACLNACEGTAAVELTLGLVEELTKARGELLDALREAREAMESAQSDLECAADEAKSAIAEHR